jgi:REP element-mobilizing transposase RayT
MDKVHRNSTRLRHFDYASSGAYFITACAYQRECIFGQVLEGKMVVNELGNIVLEEWQRSFEIRCELEPDAFVVMPNHIHGVVWIRDTVPTGVAHATVVPHVGATGRSPLRSDAPPGPRKKSVGSFIAGFKSAVTKRINESRGTPGLPVWQRNYHDRVIRDDLELNAVRAYIVSNPANWAQDARATSDLELHDWALTNRAVMA